jgi:hypothetical protein
VLWLLSGAKLDAGLSSLKSKLGLRKKKIIEK